MTIRSTDSLADERQLLKVLRKAWLHPFTIQCNFARQQAAFVAMAASKGLITTRILGNRYGRHWRVTSTGLRLINESEIL